MTNQATLSIENDLYNFFFTGGEVIRNGNYSISKHQFLKATKHFLETKQNTLPELDTSKGAK